MVPNPLDEAGLRAALDALALADPDVGRALPRIGYPQPRTRDPGFATLLRIVVAQQLSTRSAAAIWARLETACGGEVAAGRFLALDDAVLRACGFSLRKAQYGRELAAALAEGRLDPVWLAAAPDEAVIEAIVALNGFGRWSADIYLLFALGRIDVFPADDLALQVGFQRLKRLDERPRAKALRELVAPWSPWRGAGAVFLWHYYGAATLDEDR